MSRKPAPSAGSSGAYEDALHDEVGSYYADPLGFVLAMYPWGEPGTLENEPGPDEWQTEFLELVGAHVREHGFDGSMPVLALRAAVSSGHGIGKSVEVAFLVDWLMSTRPHCQGTVTANTITQLDTKTWAAIRRWTKLCKTGHWFDINSERMFHLLFPESWFCAKQSSKEQNSEAFAGQHAKDSSSFYIFDEASAIPETIYEVAEGGLTDGEPFIFLFGNPTRSKGSFHKACFGSMRHRWNPIIIDSRKSRFTNKQQIQEWIDDYGEDSDFVRVRVRGLPPRASDLQFIDQERVYEAQQREVTTFDDEPLVAGVDFSDGGSAWNIVRFRRGMDARSIPPIRIPGEKTRNDRSAFLAVLAELLSDKSPGKRLTMMFCDSAFGAPYVERLKVMGHKNVMEVRFGGDSPDPKREANMRAHMWSRTKDWLLTGAIPADDPRLESDLTAPGYHLDKRDRLVLESKESMAKRGVASPDDADALCFVAGTMVETEQGPRPIEGVRVGDRVRTPFGLSPVVHSWASDANALTTARFSTGETLVGKGEHRIFTFSRGSVRLDALSLTDEVEIFSRWRLCLWRLVKWCSTEARNSGFKAAVDTFSPGTPVPRSAFCTVGCGSMLTARFQRVRKFITSIVTGGTTPSPTLSCVPAAGTSESTWLLGRLIRSFVRNGWNGWRRPGRERPNGIARQRGEPGTRSTGSEHGSGVFPQPSCARAAANSTKRSFRVAPSIVRLLVSRLSRSAATSPTLERARIAVRNLRRTAIGRRPIVPVDVQTVSVPVTKTYNLTLAQHNAYYANGVLVFNCLTFAAPVVQTWKNRGGPAGKRQRFDGRRGSSGSAPGLAWMG